MSVAKKTIAAPEAIPTTKKNMDKWRKRLIGYSPVVYGFVLASLKTAGPSWDGPSFV
jgi:hypothetical protein